MSHELLEAGSDVWWEIVNGSPMHEREYMLKSYRATLLGHAIGTPEYSDAASTITRLNLEIHRIAQIQNRARIGAAVRNVCGDEVFAQVMEEAARLEAMEFVK